MNTTKRTFGGSIGRGILTGAALLLPAVAPAESLDPRCTEAVERLEGDDAEVAADVLGQTTGTLAVLGNLLCFVGDARCECLRAVIDSEAPERADFLGRLQTLLDACDVDEPDRSLSGVAQQAALDVCPDDRETTTVSTFNLSPMSGFVVEGGTAIDNATPTLGDNARNDEIRAILTFPLDVVPPGAQIVTATFRVTEQGIEGAPFELGRVIVDHVDSGGAFDAELFDGYDLESPIGGAETPAVLSTGEPLGEKSISVTQQVRSDLAAGRATSQLRIRFDPGGTDGDGSNDSLFLGGAMLDVEFVQ